MCCSKFLPRTDLKKVLVTRVGDFAGNPARFIVNFALKYVRKQIPEWKMPGTTTFKSALGSGLGLKLEPVPLAGEDIAFLQIPPAALPASPRPRFLTQPQHGRECAAICRLDNSLAEGQ